MHGEDRLNIKTQLIIVALKFAEFPDHISIDYDRTQMTEQRLHRCLSSKIIVLHQEMNIAKHDMAYISKGVYIWRLYKVELSY